MKSNTKNSTKKNTVSQTIRDIAIRKGSISNGVVSSTAAKYTTRLKQVTTCIMQPEELKALQVAEDYQREEKRNHIVRLTQILLKDGDFLPPIVVAVRVNENGERVNYIIDGQQRRRALVEANLPHLVIQVPFESPKDEKRHFLGIQRGMPVNKSHIVAVSDDEVAEKIRHLSRNGISKGRIFMGKGRRSAHQISAKSVENMVKRYGLDLQHLEGALDVLLAAFKERDIPASAITSSMLRGYVGFYKQQKEKLDHTDESSMTRLFGILTATQKFPRRGDNSKAGGQSCQTIISREFLQG